VGKRLFILYPQDNLPRNQNILEALFFI